MSARRRRSTPKRPVRTRNGRSRFTRMLVVCEGSETERHYLDGLKREDSVAKRFNVTVVKGRGGSRQQIVQRAIDRKQSPKVAFDEAWCVMDTESLATQEARTDLNSARDLAAANDVRVCLSNPAVEVWFLAHFVRTSHRFPDCDAVIVELDKHWIKAFGGNYAKNDTQVYHRLRDKTQIAIQHARSVRENDHGDKTDVAQCNSSTEVDILVTHLLSQATPK